MAEPEEARLGRTLTAPRDPPTIGRRGCAIPAQVLGIPLGLERARTGMSPLWRSSIRREILLLGIAYFALGVSGIALSATSKEPLPTYERVLILLASALLLFTAVAAFLRKSWTWRFALSIHLIMLLGGVVATSVQLATSEESGNLSERLLFLLSSFGVLGLYSALALFWMRPDVKAELARRRPSLQPSVVDRADGRTLGFTGEQSERGRTMEGEKLEPARAETVVEPPAAAATCCSARDEESAQACALCQRPICKNCRGVVNGRPVCAECRGKVVAELEAEQAAPAHLLPAVLGGVVASILCGAAWATIAIVTGFVIGYAAVGVGFVTGWGVVLGAGRKKGAALQWLAVGCSVLGLVIGKYFIVAHSIVTQVKDAEGLSMIDPRIIRVFFEVFPKVVTPFDGLWVFIALRVAWRIPRQTRVLVR